MFEKVVFEVLLVELYRDMFREILVYYIRSMRLMFESFVSFSLFNYFIVGFFYVYFIVCFIINGNRIFSFSCFVILLYIVFNVFGFVGC